MRKIAVLLSVLVVAGAYYAAYSCGCTESYVNNRGPETHCTYNFLRCPPGCSYAPGCETSGPGGTYNCCVSNDVCQHDTCNLNNCGYGTAQFCVTQNYACTIESNSLLKNLIRNHF